jgi:hypothetical protein
MTKELQNKIAQLQAELAQTEAELQKTQDEEALKEWEKQVEAGKAALADLRRGYEYLTVPDRIREGYYENYADSMPDPSKASKALRSEIRKKGNQIGAAIIEELKLDLFREHGIENNPKREKLWSKAWEHSHAYGLSEIAGTFEDLLDLIVD